MSGKRRCIALQGIHSIVFVDSHFVHDVIAYERRLAQFASNHECSFPEDKSVRAAFWFGDLNFRVEKEPQEMKELIGKEQTYSVLGKTFGPLVIITLFVK